MSGYIPKMECTHSTTNDERRTTVYSTIQLFVVPRVLPMCTSTRCSELLQNGRPSYGYVHSGTMQWFVSCIGNSMECGFVTSNVTVVVRSFVVVHLSSFVVRLSFVRLSFVVVRSFVVRSFVRSFVCRRLSFVRLSSVVVRSPFVVSRRCRQSTATAFSTAYSTLLMRCLCSRLCCGVGVCCLCIENALELSFGAARRRANSRTSITAFCACACFVAVISVAYFASSCGHCRAEGLGCEKPLSMT